MFELCINPEFDVLPGLKAQPCWAVPFAALRGGDSCADPASMSFGVAYF